MTCMVCIADEFAGMKLVSKGGDMGGFGGGRGTKRGGGPGKDACKYVRLKAHAISIACVR